MTLALTSALILAAATSNPASLLGQAVTVDNGEFRVSIGGQVVGVETFQILRSAAGGPEWVIARGVVEVNLGAGLDSLTSYMDVQGESPIVTAYQVVRTAEETTKVRVNLLAPRYLSITESAAGRREKEIRAEAGVLFLEDRVAHQYYFLAQAIAAGMTRVPAIIPLEGRRVDLALTVEPESTLLIGGRALPVRRVILGTGDQERRVWLDLQGRVLRVEVPSIGYQAVRTEPPSGTTPSPA